MKVYIVKIEHLDDNETVGIFSKKQDADEEMRKQQAKIMLDYAGQEKIWMPTCEIEDYELR